jgi:histidinol-phosphate/aromatic aminotransferase/cobyric acid decarboxylase-like protein
VPVQEICDRIRRDKPSLVIIASPDNPDGKILGIEDFDLVSGTCRSEGAVFLLDLTYLDFADDPSILDRALKTPGVLITGIFSNPGAGRIQGGLGKAGSEGANLIGRLREAGPPFSLSSPAIERQDRPAETDGARVAFVQRIKKERMELKGLGGRGRKPGRPRQTS